MNVCVCVEVGHPQIRTLHGRQFHTGQMYVVSILRECWTTSRALEPSMKLTLNGQVCGWVPYPSTDTSHPPNIIHTIDAHKLSPLFCSHVTV